VRRVHSDTAQHVGDSNKDGNSNCRRPGGSGADEKGRPEDDTQAQRAYDESESRCDAHSASLPKHPATPIRQTLRQIPPFGLRQDAEVSDAV
jgi:hypothetical protein